MGVTAHPRVFDFLHYTIIGFRLPQSPYSMSRPVNYSQKTYMRAGRLWPVGASSSLAMNSAA